MAGRCRNISEENKNVRQACIGRGGQNTCGLKMDESGNDFDDGVCDGDGDGDGDGKE